MDWRSRIVADSNVLVGKPVIKGTRVSVELVMDLLVSGYTPEQVCKQYDHLTLFLLFDPHTNGDQTTKPNPREKQQNPKAHCRPFDR